jgi:hypothetical protein
VHRLRDKIEIEKRAIESEKTRLLGHYNAFSRPKNSVVRLTLTLLTVMTLIEISFALFFVGS